MRYPDHQTYAALYRRFYDGRDVAELLDPLGDLRGKRVIDLCAGDGRMSFEALKRGAQFVHLVDSESEMIPKAAQQIPQFEIWDMPVITALGIMQGSRQLRVDALVCRQGVNYWFDPKAVQLAAGILQPGGKLVFNTFSYPPPEKPRVREYHLDGNSFVEVSWLIGDDVHHVQIRQGLPPHITVFKWLPQELILATMEPYFTVELQVIDKTSIYVGTKKEDL